MWTRRRNPLTGTAQHPYRMGLLIALFPPIAGILHHFTGQGAFDEYRLAIDMRKASSFMIQGFDMCLRHGKWLDWFGKKEAIIIGA